MASQDAPETKHIELGEFPFPLTDGPRESEYLTWLRNHSNYMAVGGFRDYLRSVAILLRGIIVNFLTLLPYVLIVAIVLSYAHHEMLAKPFILTQWAVVVGLAWVLAFPFLMLLYKIRRFGSSQDTGSESTIYQRDWFERSFSWALILILAIAFLESLPWILEILHDGLQADKFGWPARLATLAGPLAFLSLSYKLLSALSGVRKMLATVLVGLVGLLVPLLVILYATNFLLYSPPITPLVIFSPLMVAAVYVFLIAVSLGIGWRAFTRKEFFWLFGLIFTLLLPILILGGYYYRQWDEPDPPYDELTKIVAPMQRVASFFEKIPNTNTMPPEVTALIEPIVHARRAITKAHEDIIKERFQNAASYCHKKAETKDWWKGFAYEWGCRQKLAELEQRRFSNARTLYELGTKLVDLPENSLEPLRKEMARLAREELWLQIKKKAKDRAGYYGNQDVKGAKGDALLRDDELARRLRRSIFYFHLNAALKELKKDPSQIRGGSTGLDGKSVFTDNRSICKFNQETPDKNSPLLPLLHRLCDGYASLYKDKDPIERNAIKKMQELLLNIPNEELAELVSEKELYDVVQDKFKAAGLHGTAEMARLSGKEALARLLTPREMIARILSSKPIEEDAFKNSEDSGTEKTFKYLREDFRRATRWAFLTHVFRGLEGDELAVLAILDGADKPREPPTEEQWKNWGSDKNNAIYVEDKNEIKESKDSKEYVARVAGELLATKALNPLDVKSLREVCKLKLNHWDECLDKLKVPDKSRPPPCDPAKLKEVVKEVFPKGPNNSDIEHVLKDVKNLKLAQTACIHSDRIEEIIRAALVEQASSADFDKDDSKLALAYLAKFPTYHLKDLKHLMARGEKSEESRKSEKSKSEESRKEHLEPTPYGVVALTAGELIRIAVKQINQRNSASLEAIDNLITESMLGIYGTLKRPGKDDLTVDGKPIKPLKEQLTSATLDAKAIFILILAIVIWFGCRYTVDVNLTSIHGLYRDRLASAFLIRWDDEGKKVVIEQDLNLRDICRYEPETGSKAPYHLINAALNLQGSKDIGIRDRNSDFFIFSKRFIGGPRTGYCRSEDMEKVFPQIGLSSAMAISAAAASPNMGRGTSRLRVALMTLLNIRLGYWLPNPGLLDEKYKRPPWWKRCNPWKRRKKNPKQATASMKDAFQEVFAEEMREIKRRWGNYQGGSQRLLDKNPEPTVDHRLVGIGFSGGGIRSAAFNLGISQALHHHGFFDHVDYMSTVSGGGYLGSSISAVMRSREELVSNNDGKGDGKGTTEAGDKFTDRFSWRVRPTALVREILSLLDETHRWVNVSDGGHIENLATIELLRRRCKYIIVGDGEADPNLHFNGLANLMRCAYIDLGIEIDIDLDALRLRKAKEDDDEATVSAEHWAIGRITYPKKDENDLAEQREIGYLLYLKSSFTGDEGEAIREYRDRNPTFPHQSTADQFFGEGQFEAYRALGQHIAELAIDGKHKAKRPGEKLQSDTPVKKMSFSELENWFSELWRTRQKPKATRALGMERKRHKAST